MLETCNSHNGSGKCTYINIMPPTRLSRTVKFSTKEYNVRPFSSYPYTLFPLFFFVVKVQKYIHHVKDIATFQQK